MAYKSAPASSSSPSLSFRVHHNPTTTANKMDSKVQPLLLLLHLVAAFPFAFLPSAEAHNITRLLMQYPNFGTFNSLLSETRIAQEINSRRTITVLALDDGAAGELARFDRETLVHILAVHVILDYYDKTKLHAIKSRSTRLTTLFQTTGVADRSMGFLNFTRLSDGRLAFGSALPGSPLVATYIKQVATRPYNLSVLQISAAIVPEDISEAPHAPFGSPIQLPPEPMVPAPAPVEAPAPASTEAPADAPEVESPAPTPEADAPTGEGPGPAPEGPVEDDYEESSSTRRASGIGVGVGGLVAAVVALLSLW